MSGTSRGDALNQAAAHDTSLYDPDRHDNQIVAMYDTDEQASAARDVLTRSNVPAVAIELVSKGSDQGTLGGVNAEDRDSGFWGAIRSMFVPDDDRNAYSHAVGRGHAILLITPTADMDRQKLIRVLEGTEPVDFDARLEEWRQAGYDATAAHGEFTPGPARLGEREGGTGAIRTRSYVSPRPADAAMREERSVESRAAAPEPGTPAQGNAAQGNATQGASTSGANATRR